jgi:hypothetical protein
VGKVYRSSSRICLDGELGRRAFWCLWLHWQNDGILRIEAFESRLFFVFYRTSKAAGSASFQDSKLTA